MPTCRLQTLQNGGSRVHLRTPPLKETSGSYNVPKENSGSYNVPKENSGSYNVPKENSGCYNVPKENSGSYNVPKENSGSYNVPKENSGSYNVPKENTGSYNVPKENSGSYNVPKENTGSYNVPKENTGSYNVPTASHTTANKDKEKAGFEQRTAFNQPLVVEGDVEGSDSPTRTHTHFGLVGLPQYQHIASDKGSYKANTPKQVRRRHSDSDNEDLHKYLRGGLRQVLGQSEDKQRPFDVPVQRLLQQRTDGKRW